MIPRLPRRRYVVSFDSKVPGEADGGDRVIPNGIEGTPDPDPAYVFRITSQGAGGSAAFFRNEAVDVALIDLDQPAASVFPGITPVHIAGAGTLDAIKNGSKPSLLQVGYGATRSGPPGQPSSFSFDAIRRDSEFPCVAQGRLVLSNTNPNDANGYGSPCFGDSGSPLFYNGNEAGVNTFVGGPCNNVVGGPRLDAGPARAFSSRGASFRKARPGPGVEAR